MKEMIRRSKVREKKVWVGVGRTVGVGRKSKLEERKEMGRRSKEEEIKVWVGRRGR